MRGDPLSPLSANGSHRFVLASIASFFLFQVVGCGIPQSLDDAPGVREQILGSRLLVVQTVSPDPKSHRSIDFELASGTIVEIVHTVRRSHFEYDDDAVYAKIIFGPRRGRTIRLGTLFLDRRTGTARLVIHDLGAEKFVPIPHEPLAWLDTSAIPPRLLDAPTSTLVSASRDPCRETRYWAVLALASHANTDPAALNAIADATADRANEVQVQALTQLAKLGPAALPALPQLIGQLKYWGGSNELLIKAVCALGPSVVPEVGQLIQPPYDRPQVLGAARVLANFPSESRPFVPAVIQASDRDHNIAWDAFRIDPQAVLRHLARKLSSTDASTRSEALAMLARIDFNDRIMKRQPEIRPAALELMEAIIERIRLRDPATLESAVCALRQFGRDASVARLLLEQILTEPAPPNTLNLHYHTRWTLQQMEWDAKRK